MISEQTRYTEPIVRKIERDIKKIGYYPHFKVLNAASYGVPQFRQRVIIIGSRDPVGDEIFPEPTHFSKSMLRERAFQISSLSDDEITRRPYVTARDAIHDLEDVPENVGFAHIFTKNSDEFLEKIKRTRNGESVYGNFKEAYFRIFPDRPSPTTKENHTGTLIHYSLDRMLSPREIARLQTFGDDFILHGNKTDILKAVCNAVPPLLIKCIAEKVKKYLR